jgi:hypothetical protein
MSSRTEEILDALHEGFFYDRVHETLTNGKFSSNETTPEYLTGAINFAGKLIKAYELMQNPETNVSEYFDENGGCILSFYLSVLEILPMDRKKDKKALLTSLKEFEETLMKMRDNIEVSEERKNLAIEIFDKLRRKNLSQTAMMMYQ